jgi:hypothetical protein
MKLASVDTIVNGLERAGVRYLVAGGLAVNAHGILRFTKDIDLVVQLVPDNAKAAFSALATLGYRPVVPVTAEQFADAKVRGAWVSEKRMEVLQFWSDSYRETPIDLFVREPFPFDEEYARALVKPLGAIAVRFVSIPTLIAMKTAAGRAQDKIDVENLRIRLKDHGGK